jgi:PAS domain S-box-containing protein
MVHVATLSPLPCLVADAISTMQWPLDRPSAARPMKLLPLHSLETPVFPSCGEIHALELVHLIASQASQTATTTTTTTRTEQWAQIASAILLLGHGYADHAHNLIGPLSFQNDLPYFHGPVVITDSDILAAASWLHALVHRREGPHPSEFGATGYINSDFWASAALRSGGEETLPLSIMRSRVQELATECGPAAQEWFYRNYHSHNIVEEWDPRPLTALCEAVLPATPFVQNQRKHTLLEFTQQAALTELRVLLEHALTHLGYHRIHESTRLSLGMRLLLPSDTERRLPRTLKEASSQSFQDDAVVVTTPTHPHQIVYVNDAWVEMCGYSPDMAKGKTFSMLLHGQESNAAVARLAAKQCFDTQLPHEVYVVNYTAAGERFVNHVTMGPMYKESHELFDSDNQSTAIGSGQCKSMQQPSSPPIILEYMVAILKRVENGSDIAIAA